MVANEIKPMKTKSTFSTGALIAVVLLSLLGGIAKSAEKQIEQNRVERREPLGEVVKASEVLGKEVENLQDEKLGKVEELAVDVESGRIVYVILSVTGTGNKKNVAAISQNFRCDHTNKVVRLNLSKEKIKSAPAFDLSQWDDFTQSNRVFEVYYHFNQRPYFVGHIEGKRIVPPNSPLGYVARASKVVGMPVRNKSDEKLGSVDNLIVNLEHGRIAQVIVSSGGFLGMGDALSAVPSTAFRYNDSHEFLQLDVTKEDLARAPHFKNNEWPNFGDARYVGSVYRAYRAEPYFATEADADNTRRNARDRDGNKLTPLDQGNSASDVETTKSIRQQLVAQDDLSVNARNVKIITVDGRVTLRGPVNSEEEKRQIVAITSRVVSPNRVNNELEVKRENN